MCNILLVIAIQTKHLHLALNWSLEQELEFEFKYLTRVLSETTVKIGLKSRR